MPVRRSTPDVALLLEEPPRGILMQVSFCRSGCRALGFVVLLLAAALPAAALAADAAPAQPSKIAASLQRTLDRIDAATATADRKQAESTTAAPSAEVGARDLSSLSDGLVKVRPTGEVEVV